MLSRPRGIGWRFDDSVYCVCKIAASFLKDSCQNILWTGCTDVIPKSLHAGKNQLQMTHGFDPGSHATTQAEKMKAISLHIFNKPSNIL
jgi:hypothetical protein